MERCNHGFSPLPRGHVCALFIPSFVREYSASTRNSNIDRFDDALEATSTKYETVWHNPDMLENVISHFLAEGASAILEGKHDLARHSGVIALLFEQHRDVMTGNDAGVCRNTSYYVELSNDSCDEHTLVSVFRRRIPCKCLDKRYKEVKSIVKMGHGENPDSILPDGKTERSKLMKCQQCCMADYCSTECQKADWPSHKECCVAVSYNMKL